MSFTLRLAALALVLGCSDATGVDPASPHSTGGAGGTSGHSTGGRSTGAAGWSGGRADGGGRSGGQGGLGPAGFGGRGGATSRGGAGAGTFQSGGSPASNGGAGRSSSGGKPQEAGSAGLGRGGATAAGASGTGGQARGGSAGGAGRAGSSGVGGAPSAAGTGGASGSSGSIDTSKVTTSCPGAVPSGVASTWCSCAQWGEKASGSYTYYNDIWGTGPGPQCIWLTDSGEWGITSQHPNSSGIKSYPNVSLSPQKAISSINTYTSAFDVIVPSGGAYEAAYDLWVKGTTSTRIEIMLWMTYRGGVQPIAKAYDASGAVPDVTNVTVGGHTWNVYYGSNGANDVASFLRTSNTSSASVDVKAILLWLIANNKSSYAVFSASYTLDQVQFGYEITSDASTQAYVTKKFTVSSD